MNKFFARAITSLIPIRHLRKQIRYKLIHGEDLAASVNLHKFRESQENFYACIFELYHNEIERCVDKENNYIETYKDQLLQDLKFCTIGYNRNFLRYSEKYIWGIQYNNFNIDKIVNLFLADKPKPFFVEDTFLRSAVNVFNLRNEDNPKYGYSVGYSLDDLTCYYDATRPSRIELMLNDKKLIISKEQKDRARKCINKIVETHLTKYNHQPIFTPKIGREGVKKILVIDQSFGDMSIARGWGSEEIFQKMLQTAINENPDADIIVKTHPDTMSGARGGYFTGLVPHDNVYTQTEAINPISLIKYVDKVYVCTTQFGFEALMCGKEVHVFGMPFYAGWGLTIDEQINPRRTNKRSLEEVFYIAYIMCSVWINPEMNLPFELEDAIDYLLKMREEYFQEKHIVNELKKYA